MWANLRNSTSLSVKSTKWPMHISVMQGLPMRPGEDDESNQGVTNGSALSQPTEYQK